MPAKPKILIDINIILDVLQNRQPLYSTSAQVLAAVETGLAEGYVTAHTVTTLFYLIRKDRSAAEARAALTALLQFLAVCPVEQETLEQALNLDYRDFEDAVQMISALRARVDYPHHPQCQRLHPPCFRFYRQQSSWRFYLCKGDPNDHSHRPATLLELRHIQQNYTSGARKFTAVQDVNLKLQEGEFVALLGPSGCGKSTLLRILTGLQKPSEGQIIYRGQPLKGVNPYATIVFQTFALFPWLTVLENVELALKARGVAASLRIPRALDLLDRVGLDGFENAYPRELSGGMRQKVGFARAMAVRPELLCLDEPFSALDVLSARSLRNELMELWTSGSIPTEAILMVSHNIEEAVLMADRIVVMDKEPGRIVAEIRVDLPHPRQRHSDEFRAVVDNVYALLAGQTQPEAAELGSGSSEAARAAPAPCPTSTSATWPSLLEYLSEKPDDQDDIYRLTEELKIDSDHVAQPDGNCRTARLCHRCQRRYPPDAARRDLCRSLHPGTQRDVRRPHPPPAAGALADGHVAARRQARPEMGCGQTGAGTGIPARRSRKTARYPD